MFVHRWIYYKHSLLSQCKRYESAGISRGDAWLELDALLIGRGMKKKSNKITDKQRLFAHELSSGRYSMAECYRRVYAAENMTPNAVRVEASRLAAHPNVSLLLERLRADKERNMQATSISDKERVLERLRHFIDSAEPTDSNKIRAAELLGKAAGVFAHDLSISVTERDTNEVASEIEKRLAALLSTDAENLTETQHNDSLN